MLRFLVHVCWLQQAVSLVQVWEAFRFCLCSVFEITGFRFMGLQQVEGLCVNLQVLLTVVFACGFSRLFGCLGFFGLLVVAWTICGYCFAGSRFKG